MLAAEHGVGASVPTVSAAGTTPTALRPRHPCRVVNAPRWPRGGGAVPTVSAAGTTPRVVRRKRSRYSPIGGRKSADRPTPAPSVGWSTPRVGHQVGLRCPPYRGPEQRRPPYPRAILVGWSTPRVGHR